MQNLELTAEEKWNWIPQETFKDLLKSMLRKMQDVDQARGGFFFNF